MPPELPPEFFAPRDGPVTKKDESPTADTYYPKWITPQIAKQLRYDQVPETEVPRQVPPYQHLRYESFTSCEYQKPATPVQILPDGCIWYRLVESCVLRTKVYWVQASQDLLVDDYKGVPTTKTVWVRACPDGSRTVEGPNTPKHTDLHLPAECAGSAHAYTAPGGDVLGEEYVWKLRLPVTMIDECHAVATYVLYLRKTVTTGPIAETSQQHDTAAVPEQTATTTYDVCVPGAGSLALPATPLEEQAEIRTQPTPAASPLRHCR